MSSDPSWSGSQPGRAESEPGSTDSTAPPTPEQPTSGSAPARTSVPPGRTPNQAERHGSVGPGSPGRITDARGTPRGAPEPSPAKLRARIPAREIIVATTGREVRAALMESGRLAELQVDRGDERGFVGNVYLGRVVRVLPGMQAAFVDIGLERAAFLYVGDIYPDLLHMHEEGEEVSEEGDPPAPEDRPRATTRAGQPAIQDLLKEGQEIVVQVAKDPIGTKGARLTTHIALPGRAPRWRASAGRSQPASAGTSTRSATSSAARRG